MNGVGVHCMTFTKKLSSASDSILNPIKTVL